MQVIATENRNKAQVQEGGGLRAGQHGGTVWLREDSRFMAEPAWSKPVLTQVDSGAFTAMMHYYPVIRVVMLSLMLSLTASLSSNMNAIRKVIQDKQAPV